MSRKPQHLPAVFRLNNSMITQVGVAEHTPEMIHRTCQCDLTGFRNLSSVKSSVSI
jgi:hypothetical protein